MTRRAAKEQSPATCATTRPPLYNIHNNIPLPASAPSIPCPDSDRRDTTGVHVHPPRRSSPAIDRFCPTLGWLHLVKSVTHRAAAHVAFAAPIVLNAPDMWSRDEDNHLLLTVANTIPLNDYNPKWDVCWNLVAEKIPGRLPQQCRARYMPAAFLAQLTWGFLGISVGIIHYAPASSLLCVYNDSRDSSRKPAPSPSLCYSLTHAHRSIGYRNQTQPLAESAARLMYLRGLYNSTSKWLTTSLAELMYRLSMYDAPPSV